jgi:hypothetical protein
VQVETHCVGGVELFSERAEEEDEFEPFKEGLLLSLKLACLVHVNGRGR